MKLSHASSSAVILVFSCLLIAVPANSQENVHVTVSVTNPGNAPVLNLLKGEFSVQDSGKPQVITSFAAPNDKPGAPPQLQPNEFSNVPDFRETSGAIFSCVRHNPHPLSR
jgi:hypothetical protein